jgi:hypothetical protein
MEQSKKNYAYRIFLLKEYLKKIFGSHYPIEIITLIIMDNYRHPEINCGSDYTTLLYGGKTYVWGNIPMLETLICM